VKPWYSRTRKHLQWGCHIAELLNWLTFHVLSANAPVESQGVKSRFASLKLSSPEFQ